MITVLALVFLSSNGKRTYYFDRHDVYMIIVTNTAFPGSFLAKP